MKCQMCGQRPATTHIKQRTNGYESEWYVCSECAVTHSFHTPHGLSMGTLFGGLFTQPFLKETEQGKACPLCGMTFREIVQNGQVGCPECYTTFYERLQPSVQRVHGKTTHVGKVPSGGSQQVRKQREIEALKAELNAAVSEQEFERCAELRDRIKHLEEGDV